MTAMTALHTLSLTDNDIGPSGAAFLAPSLMTLTGLCSLNLSDNSIDAAGAASLTPSLMALTGLTRLELSGNWIWGSMGYGPSGLLRASLTHITGLNALII